MDQVFCDIHCHIVPGIDDGAADLETALDMARAAVADGTTTVIATPHQLGSHRANDAAQIRAGVAALAAALDTAAIPLAVLPGGDVRIEPELPALVKCGTVLTLADRGRHVLLELPHDRYVPLEPLLVALGRQGLTGILSHPERNRGLIAEPAIVETLVQQGCLMQITAGSLLGQFGASAERLARFLVERRLCHFVASDAHDTRRRPFGLGAAHQAVARLADESFADTVCRENPALVTAGREVACRSVGRPKRRVGLSGWLKTG